MKGFSFEPTTSCATGVTLNQRSNLIFLLFIGLYCSIYEPKTKTRKINQTCSSILYGSTVSIRKFQKTIYNSIHDLKTLFPRVWLTFGPYICLYGNLKIPRNQTKSWQRPYAPVVSLTKIPYQRFWLTMGIPFQASNENSKASFSFFLFSESLLYFSHLMFL